MRLFLFEWSCGPCECRSITAGGEETQRPHNVFSTCFSVRAPHATFFSNFSFSRTEELCPFQFRLSLVQFAQFACVGALICRFCLKIRDPHLTAFCFVTHGFTDSIAADRNEKSESSLHCTHFTHTHHRPHSGRFGHPHFLHDLYRLCRDPQTLIVLQRKFPDRFNPLR